MNKKSFTLIELLVVIAIIGILSSLVIARFSNWNDNARIVNILQWSAGVHRKLGANLVGHWPLNEGSGVVASDISGYGNHGDIIGNPTWVDGVPGTSAQALKFDEVSDYVDTNNLFVFSKDDSFTVSFWVNFEEFGGDRATLVGKGHYYNNTWNVEDDTGRNNGIRFELGSPHDEMIRISISQNKFYLNKWTHIAAVYNGNTKVAYLYLNSNEEINHIYSYNNNFNNDNTVGLRRDRDFGSSVLSLNDVCIYSTALTAEEVGRIYAENKDSYLAYE